MLAWDTGRRTGAYRTIIQVLVLKGSRFVPLGRKTEVEPGALARLATSTDGTVKRIEVGLAGQTDPSIRRVISLRKDGSWAKSPILPLMTSGSFTSDPVRDGKRIYLPVAEAGWDKPFEFSIWSRIDGRPWKKVGKSLNQGFGQAQGDIYGVCGSVWAIWNEANIENSEFGGWFPVEIYAAKAKPGGSTFGPALRLWKRNTFFPNSAQMTCYRGRPAFLYSREFSRKSGIHATVDLRSPKQIRAEMAKKR